MVKETITSLDVAKAAGVSQSAVSRVFTPGASVSPTMRQRVEEAANKLGYRPNALARSLITGKSRIIGLVLAYLENQFYPDALEKLSHALQKRGYHVLVFFASDATDNIDAVLEEILDYQVDGIVLASASLSFELAGRCHDAGVPVVLFNRRQNEEGISYVTSDNYAGGRKLARFLADGGHQRIGYIAGWEGAATQIDREAGFLAGLSEVNLELFAREVGDYKWELAAEATRRMFNRKDKPDAVFVANDHMAFATLEVLRHEFSLRVPEDVSVVSYDDVLLSSWPSFNLTTLRQPINRMVDATVEALLARIEEDDTVLRRVAIDGPLVIRGSSRVPRA